MTAVTQCLGPLPGSISSSFPKHSRTDAIQHFPLPYHTQQGITVTSPEKHKPPSELLDARQVQTGQEAAL